MLELLTPLVSASAIGAGKKNIFTPNPIRIAVATAIACYKRMIAPPVTVPVMQYRFGQAVMLPKLKQL
jgi:hypothetical protein